MVIDTGIQVLYHGLVFEWIWLGHTLNEPGPCDKLCLLTIYGMADFCYLHVHVRKYREKDGTNLHENAILSCFKEKLQCVSLINLLLLSLCSIQSIAMGTHSHQTTVYRKKTIQKRYTGTCTCIW